VCFCDFRRRFTQPEDGVTVYAADPTQGPACALACAAGSVYRNYFCPRELLFDSDSRAPVEIKEGEEPYPGQSLSLQVKCTMKRRCDTLKVWPQVNNLAGVHRALDNSAKGYYP
jgi:hypothetical protein